MSWVSAVRSMDWLRERVEVIPDTGCWEWKLARNKLGYGQYGDNSGPKHKTSKAHRLSFSLANGYLPAVVLHACDNPPCCNPDHLRGESQFDNMRDMVAKDRSVAKLTLEDADEIRSALAHGAVGRHLAKAYGVSETAISNIKRRRTWSFGDRGNIERKCLHCGQDLPPVRNGMAVYCDRRCREPAYRLRQGQKPRKLKSKAA